MIDVFGNERSGRELLQVSRSAPLVLAPRAQESTPAVLVRFSRPVTGVKPSSLLYGGAIGGSPVDLPVTTSKLTGHLGVVTVTAIEPDGGGRSTTWRISFGKAVPSGQQFTLKLKASGSGITDDVGNLLMTDAQTPVAC